MSRELKFRAWHKGYASKTRFDKGVPAQMLFDERPGDCLVYLSQGQPVEVMQYTGLKDKNGVEIYEGDIIEWKWDIGKTEIEYVLHSTAWDGLLNPNSNPFMSAYGSTCGKYFKTFMNAYDPTRYSIVIGNIHQNPELL